MSVQDRFPVRYSLLPEQRKLVAAQLKKRGGATNKQIDEIAKHHNVAKKTVLSLINNLHLKVLDDPRPQKVSASQTSSKKKTAQDKAEAAFKTQRQIKEEIAAKPLPEKEFDAKLGEILDLEESQQKKYEETLAYLASVENELAEAKKAAEESEARAREEIRKTAELRRSTSGYRERIDELESELNIAQRREAKATAQANAMTAELKAGVKREKRLLEALQGLRQSCTS